MNWNDKVNTIIFSVIVPLCIVLILSTTLYLCGWYKGYDKAKQSHQVKWDLKEEMAYFKRVKILIFDELKRNFSCTKGVVPAIAICPIHDCCIIQSKNNEIIHYQF